MDKTTSQEEPRGLTRSDLQAHLRSSALRACVVVFFCLCTRLLFSSTIVEAVIELKSTAGTEGELFFGAAGEPYSPERRAPFKIAPDGVWHTYRVRLPEKGSISQLRIDPGTGKGEVSIRSLEIRGFGESSSLSGKALKAALQMRHLLSPIAVHDDAELRFAAEGGDLYMGFSVPPIDTEPSTSRLVVDAVLAAAGWASLWLIGDVLASLALAWVWQKERVRKLTARACAALSDPGVVSVDPPALLAIALFCVAAALYVGLDLSQSSIGVWEEMYPFRPVDQMIDLGEAKHIRSDEWNVSTPWLLGQVQRGEPVINENIGGEKTPLLAFLPVSHPTAVAQIKFFGFYLFDLETGFSWYWAYKTFALAMSFFWLLYILTRGSLPAALLGSAWLYFSSFIQWWFSVGMPEEVTGCIVSTVGALYALFAQRRIWMAFGVLLLGYGIATIALHLYPPFLLPLIYLGAFVVIGFAFAPSGLDNLRSDLRWRLGCLAIGLLPTAVLLADFVLDARSTMNAMMHTVYPGRRFSSSGDVQWYRLMYGFFEGFRFDEHKVPLPPSNASEASSFVILAPIVLLVLSFRQLIARENRLLLWLLMYCGMVGSWISVRLPSWVDRILQLGGWWISPPFRSVIGLGVGSIIVVSCLFARQARLPRHERLPWPTPAFSLAIFVMIWLFGQGLAFRNPDFFSTQVVLAGALLATLIASGAAFGQAHLFAAGIALASVGTFRVNPLLSGLSSISDKPVFVAARKHSRSERDRWAVMGEFVFAQGLKAQGLAVLNGSHAIPNEKLHLVLDPKRSSEEVWNRYAHVVLDPALEPGDPVYTLLGMDIFSIRIDVCGPHLRRLGVTHVAYTGVAPERDKKCLTPLSAPSDAGVEFYRLR